MEMFYCFIFSLFSFFMEIFLDLTELKTENTKKKLNSKEYLYIDVRRIFISVIANKIRYKKINK